MIFAQSWTNNVHVSHLLKFMLAGWTDEMTTTKAGPQMPGWEDSCHPDTCELQHDQIMLSVIITTPPKCLKERNWVASLWARLQFESTRNCLENWDKVENLTSKLRYISWYTLPWFMFQYVFQYLLEWCVHMCDHATSQALLKRFNTQKQTTWKVFLEDKEKLCPL